jgi:AcrR family transcriptional regulator
MSDAHVSAPLARRPGRRRRSDRALANDRRILDAAVHVLRTRGYDGLGVSQVARQAGLTSTGAVYARFEDIAELAVWVWGQRGAAAVHDALDRAVGLLDATDDDGTAEVVAGLAADLARPSEELWAGLELLAVARRVEELEEVVRPDVERWLQAWDADRAPLPGATGTGTGTETGTGADDDGVRRTLVRGQVGLVLGALLLSLPGSWAEGDGQGILRSTVGLAWRAVVPTGTYAPVLPSLGELRTGEPVRDHVLEAAAAVMARAGFERSTVSRIARRAGYSTGVIYEYYDGKAALMSELVDVVVGATHPSILEADRAVLAAGEGGPLSGPRLAGYLRAEVRQRQLLEVEVHLAGAHHPEVASSLHRAMSHRTSEHRGALERAGVPPGVAAVASAAGRALDHGVALLDAVAGPLEHVDWRPYVDMLLTEPGR